MKVGDITELPRDVYYPSAVDWESKFTPLVVPRFALFVNTVLFELRKTTIKFKCRMAQLAKQKLISLGRRREKFRNSISYTESSLMLELGAQLSSIIPDSTINSSSSCSSLYGCTRRLTDLDDISVLHIVALLDGPALLAVAQVCRKLRNIIKKNINCLKRRKSTLFDLYIDLNKETGREDVRALKRRRSLQDRSFSGTSIRDVVPPLLTCPLRVFFGNKVAVCHWIAEIRSLYSEKRLLPISITFAGGSFTRGMHRAGADLRCFTETGFTNLIRLFVPDLKEVQLFKLSFTPRFLFAMINMLSVFGMVYERPPLRYSSGDLCEVIQTWQNSSRSHSCEVYIARPHGSEALDWSQYGRPDVEEETKVKFIRIRHAFLEDVVLTFHLH